MILMRTLRKDYVRYSRDEELDDIVSQQWGRVMDGFGKSGSERMEGKKAVISLE